MGRIYWTEHMKVAGRYVLEEYSEDHPDAREALDAWLAEVRVAQWSTPLDVRTRYPDAKFVNKHVIFKVLWNRYRLDTMIAYNTKTIVIKRVGTHADYDGWKF